MKKLAYRRKIAIMAMQIKSEVSYIFNDSWIRSMEAEYIGGDVFDLYFKHSTGRYLFTQLVAPVKQLQKHAQQHIHGWPDVTKQNNILKFYVLNSIIKIKDTDTQEYALAIKNANALAPYVGEQQPDKNELQAYEYSHQGPLLGKVETALNPNAIKEQENVRAVNPQVAPQQLAPQLSPASKERKRKRAISKRK